MGNSLETSVQNALDVVKNLSQKFNFFINGNGIMQTDNGPVESIGAIARRMASTGYFHPIVEFDSYESLIETIPPLPQDAIGYVTADPDPRKRGLYQVQSDGSYLKQSYQAITGLVSENGRKLSVMNEPVTSVTGRVNFFKMIVPTNVEDTIWVDMDLRAYLIPDTTAMTRKASLMIRVNQDNTYATDLVVSPPVSNVPSLDVKCPSFSVSIALQNAETEDENLLITIAIDQHGSNALVTLTANDTSCLIYKAIPQDPVSVP